MRLLFVLVLCLIVAAACQPQAAPTLAPTLPPPPSTTPAPTLPPPPCATPLVRETRPPTWTPVVLPTETPTPFYTPFAVLGLPPAPACAEFGEDFTRNSTNFALDSAPLVFWRPLPG